MRVHVDATCAESNPSYVRIILKLDTTAYAISSRVKVSGIGVQNNLGLGVIHLIFA